MSEPAEEAAVAEVAEAEVVVATMEAITKTIVHAPWVAVKDNLKEKMSIAPALNSKAKTTALSTRHPHALNPRKPNKSSKTWKSTRITTLHYENHNYYNEILRCSVVFLLCVREITNGNFCLIKVFEPVWMMYLSEICTTDC